MQAIFSISIYLFYINIYILYQDIEKYNQRRVLLQHLAWITSHQRKYSVLWNFPGGVMFWVWWLIEFKLQVLKPGYSEDNWLEIFSFFRFQGGNSPQLSRGRTPLNFTEAAEDVPPSPPPYVATGYRDMLNICFSETKLNFLMLQQLNPDENLKKEALFFLV